MTYGNYLNLMSNLWKISANNRYKKCVKKIDNNIKIIKKVFKFLNYEDNNKFIDKNNIKEGLDAILDIKMEEDKITKGIEYFSNKK